MTELDRIKFIIERDGLEAAIKFSEQGIAVYIEMALQSKPELKKAIEEYKEFLISNGKSVKIVNITEK